MPRWTDETIAHTIAYYRTRPDDDATLAGGDLLALLEEVQVSRSCCRHASDCAQHNGPAEMPGLCSCGVGGVCPGAELPPAPQDAGQGNPMPLGRTGFTRDCGIPQDAGQGGACGVCDGSGKVRVNSLTLDCHDCEGTGVETEASRMTCENRERGEGPRATPPSSRPACPYNCTEGRVRFSCPVHGAYAAKVPVRMPSDEWLERMIDMEESESPACPHGVMAGACGDCIAMLKRTTPDPSPSDSRGGEGGAAIEAIAHVRQFCDCDDERLCVLHDRYESNLRKTRDA